MGFVGILLSKFRFNFKATLNHACMVTCVTYALGTCGLTELGQLESFRSTYVSERARNRYVEKIVHRFLRYVQGIASVSSW